MGSKVTVAIVSDRGGASWGRVEKFKGMVYATTSSAIPA